MVFEKLNVELQNFTTSSSEYFICNNKKQEKDMKIDIVNLLPDYNPFNNVNLELKVNRENVTISWINKNRKGRILNPQNQPTPFTVLRYITVDENLGEILGLYFGDGTKDDPSCAEFSNSCPELIKLWLSHLSCFNVKTENLHFNVKVSENVKLKYEITEDEIKDYWRRILNIPIEIEISIAWIKTKSKPSTYLQKYGTCAIRYFNTTFSVFYNSLIKNIPNFLEINKQFRIGFLRGIIASDGNINIKRNASLTLVRIAGNKSQRQFISLILSKYFHIESNEDKSNQIYFGNIKNLKKIKELELHSLHPNKKRKFEKGYEQLLKNINRKHDENCILKNKIAIQILKELERSSLKTQVIIQRFGVSREWIRDILNGYKHGQKYRYNGLKKLGLVLYKRNLNRRCEKIWSITKKGKKFLENLNQN